MSDRERVRDAVDRARLSGSAAWWTYAIRGAYAIADECAAAGDMAGADEWESIAAGYVAESDAAVSTGETGPAHMCNCEHADHDAGGPAHAMFGEPLGPDARNAAYVGLVCGECARGHMAAYLLDTGA